MNIERPSKHQYYIGIAAAVSARSTCLRRHYGCVIVKNDEIIATGYNGNPRGMVDCIATGVCTKEDKSHNSSPDSYEQCKAVHAEMNALLSAPRSELIGSDLYLYCWDCEKQEEVRDAFPCPICLRLIQNAGVRSVNNREAKFMDRSQVYGSAGDTRFQSRTHFSKPAAVEVAEAVDYGRGEAPDSRR